MQESETERKHTPPEWFLIAPTDGQVLRTVILGRRHHPLTMIGRIEEIKLADAEFIILACNSHYKLTEQRDKLVEALRAVSKACRIHLGDQDREETGEFVYPGDQTMEAAEEAARAAIAATETE